LESLSLESLSLESLSLESLSLESLSLEVGMSMTLSVGAKHREGV
jgi:hypothetical protein